MSKQRTGVVLSGGGARGAYEVGVLCGLVEVLGPREDVFDTFSGASVGAVHVAWLAAHAHLPDYGLTELAYHWREMKVDDMIAPSATGLASLLRPKILSSGKPGALLDAGLFQKLVSEQIPWEALDKNLASGRVHALIVAALRVADGVTVLFHGLAPGVTAAPSRDPSRFIQPTRIGAEQVLASAALPFLFPVAEVDGEYFCDGGLRFNTPISPALRVGAERLVVIPLLHRPVRGDPPVKPQMMGPVFLLGKLLDALLLDPVAHDLHILERFNKLVQTMDDILEPEQRARLDDALRQTRGLPYRKVPTIVFNPSKDIGHLARAFALSFKASRRTTRALLRWGTSRTSSEADLLSIVLFDGGFADVLINLGRQDVLARADEVRAFWA